MRHYVVRPEGSHERVRGAAKQPGTKLSPDSGCAGLGIPATYLEIGGLAQNTFSGSPWGLRPVPAALLPIEHLGNYSRRTSATPSPSLTAMRPMPWSRKIHTVPPSLVLMSTVPVRM